MLKPEYFNKFSFNDLLSSRSNPYEIDLELQVRKLFEIKTNYTYEFQKNNDKYGYDIAVFKYYIYGADWIKKNIAYFEIEISENWVDRFPDYWHDYSFLARKVFKIENNSFTSELKENAKKTVYVIFNKSITDCICQRIDLISTFEVKNRNIMNKVKTDTFLITDLNDKRIVRGLDNMFDFCNNFLYEQYLYYNDIES